MNFRDALLSGRTLLMDGPMGTELMRRGYLGPTWRANLDAVDLVASIHREYAAAGAELLVTNTMLLNPTHVSEDDAIAAGQAAVRIARSIAGPRWILGSIGPMSTKGPNFEDRDAVLLAVKALAGVDGLMLETCSDDTAFTAAHWIRERHRDLPVVVSFAFAPHESAKALALAQAAEQSAVAAIGVNCGRDQSPADVGATLRLMRRETSKPLFARPNLGTPKREGDGWKYLLSLEEWVAETAKLRAIGLAMIGGCCGTTPEFIRRLQTATSAS